MKKIDFVVTWLDSTDPEWQKSYTEYSLNTKGDKSEARFRNMEIFPYWFRAIEKYAPWVHKIYLITNGKFPNWINNNHPKLVLVKHEDYMPKEFLPTFNSIAIELYIHKIKGLSEYFVYFNDDMLLNSPVTPDYYFKDGLPCDINRETCYNVPIYTAEDRYGIYLSMLADIGIINGHFRRWDTVVQSPWRWYGPHLGIIGITTSIILLRKRLFVGFSNYHIEQAYIKSVFEEVWNAAPDFMKASCSRFREDVTANPYIFRYWQFAKNLFYPKKREGAYFHIGNRNELNRIKNVLQNNKIKSICLNDSSLCNNEDFLYIKERLHQLFEIKFPQKSSFEI